MKKLLALAFVLALTSAASGGIFGPLFSGSPQTPPSAFAPVVAANTCNIALPVVSQNVVLVGGGTCQYTATCNGAACGGVNAITSWAITAQSTANAFAVTPAGVLQGGSAASSVTTAAYTVTVTATNTAGTSPGVVQTVNAFAAPVVASHACTIKSPVTNGSNVVLQAGGNCQYTATCSGGSCSGGNAISAWTITSQTRTNGYQITSAGILQGGSSAASITNETDTVTITATNAGGTSAAVGQTVTAISVPVITNQNASAGLPLANGQTIMTMVASPTPASWAITAVSSSPSGAIISDFAISSGGVITTTSSAPTDITTPKTVTISITATNATGTSATGTATVTIANVTSCPQGTSFADGCSAAPAGTPQFPNLLNASGATNGMGTNLHATHSQGWNVAGVDYYVGIDRTVHPTLTPIASASLPAGATYSGNKITVSSAGAVHLDGLDFTNGGLIWNGGGGTLLVTNSLFRFGSNNIQPVTVNADGLTLQNFEIDGGFNAATYGGALAAHVTFAAMSGQMVYGRGITALYGYVHDVPVDAFRPDSGGTQITKYVLFHNFSAFPNFYDSNVAHSDCIQFNVGTSISNSVLSFNTNYQTAALGNNQDSVLFINTHVNGITASNNTSVIDSNAQNDQFMVIGNNISDSPATIANAIVQNNYNMPDQFGHGSYNILNGYSGAFTPSFPTSPTVGGNINLLTGASDPL